MFRSFSRVEQKAAANAKVKWALANDYVAGESKQVPAKLSQTFITHSFQHKTSPAGSQSAVEHLVSTETPVEKRKVEYSSSVNIIVIITRTHAHSMYSSRLKNIHFEQRTKGNLPLKTAKGDKIGKWQV